MAERQVVDTERLEQAIISVFESFQPAIDALVEAFRGFADYLIREFGPTLLKGFTLIMPQRWEGESLVDWGKRLEQVGLLDKYEYRWMYQKECWRALLHSPVWLVKLVWTRVRGK